MPRALGALALAAVIAAPAWGQTTWETDRFTVSTANMTEIEIVDGSVHLVDLPQSVSNPGTNPGLYERFYDLAFAPRSGYVLRGEQVTYAVDMDLDVFDRPTDFELKPSGQFTVAIDGVPPVSRTIDGGELHYRGNAFIASPIFDARASANAFEGFACPLGSGADDCRFGGDLAPLDASVRFLSFTVTPLVSAIPEPRTAWLWLIGLVACLARATAPGRAMKPRPGLRSSCPDDPATA